MDIHTTPHAMLLIQSIIL